jgi:hypothetical protein
MNKWLIINHCTIETILRRIQMLHDYLLFRILTELRRQEPQISHKTLRNYSLTCAENDELMIVPQRRQTHANQSFMHMFIIVDIVEIIWKTTSISHEIPHENGVFARKITDCR